MCLRYLHISDLHLTGQPRDGEGWASEQFNQDIVTRSMIEAIQTLVRQNGKALDLIFITGDLAKRGKPEEYQVAEVFCRRLLEVTGVPAERLFLVPGNHDVDRGKVEDHHIRRLYSFDKEDQITEVLGDSDMFPVLMRKFAAFNSFAERVLGRRVYTECDYSFKNG
jgi:3',5'-cyclic AMP phosphodiesterase CpdA